MADTRLSNPRTASDASDRSGQTDRVGQSGIYPASGPHPKGDAELRGQGELAHPEERVRGLLTAGARATSTVPLLLGRAIFGGYFIYNGINHFQNHRMMTGYAKSKGVVAPGLAVAATGAMLLAGGISLLTGTRPKLGATLIMTFLAGVSPQMHAFWKETDQQQQMNEMINFTKNVALAGGALFAAAQPEPWQLSVRF